MTKHVFASEHHIASTLRLLLCFCSNNGLRLNDTVRLLDVLLSDFVTDRLLIYVYK